MFINIAGKIWGKINFVGPAQQFPFVKILVTVIFRGMRQKSERGLWEELGKGDFGWEEKEEGLMVMPLPKVRLGKGEPGKDQQGWEGQGKAWESSGKLRGVQWQLLSLQSQTLQVWPAATAGTWGSLSASAAPPFPCIYKMLQMSGAETPRWAQWAPHAAIYPLAFCGTTAIFILSPGFAAWRSYMWKRWFFTDCCVGHCSSDYFWA